MEGRTISSALLFHHPCIDGIFSALAAHLSLGSNNLVCIPHQTNVLLDLVALKRTYPNVLTLYLVDYCGPSTTFLATACQLFDAIVLLDHHKTANDVVSAVPKNLMTKIDIHQSGCMLALNYFKPNISIELQRMFEYVQDNDLWLHVLPESKAFTAGFMSLKLNYDPNANPYIFSLLQDLSVKDMIERGRPEVERQNKLIQELVNVHNYRVRVQLPNGGGTITVLAVETTEDQYDIRSQLGHELAIRNKETGIGAVLSGPQDKWSVSLRSTAAGGDTTIISQAFGGGGHRNASGCMIDKAKWASF